MASSLLHAPSLFHVHTKTVVPKTLTGEVAVAITSDSNLETKVTLNPPPLRSPFEGTDVLNPSEEIIIQLQHIDETVWPEACSMSYFIAQQRQSVVYL